MKINNSKWRWPVTSEVLPLLLVKFWVENNQQAIIFGPQPRPFLEKNSLILLEIKSQFLGSSSENVWKLFLIIDLLLINSKMIFKNTNCSQKRIQTTSLWNNPRKFVKLLLQGLLFNKTSKTNQQIQYIFFL